MLKKENRLKKNKQFNYIYKKGNTEFEKHINLCFLKTKFKPFKVGFSVSNKIGKSNVRNKVKRRLRESFKILMADCKDDFNLIFVAKCGIENLTFKEICLEMKRLLEKAKIINV